MMKVNVFPLPEMRAKATGNAVRDLAIKARKGEKIRLVDTISRDVMRTPSLVVS
jgi:hypothetical protein